MENSQKTTVCYFGSHKKDYSRNNIIKKGLLENGIEVIDCSSRSNVLLRSFVLFAKFLKIRKKIDVIIVSEMSHAAMPCAKFLSALFGRRIIFDPLISAYDTIVEDRKIIKKGSLLSKIIRSLDKVCMRMSDIVIADTEEHVEYFSEQLGVQKSKIKVIPVGADTDIYYPSSSDLKNKGKFSVLFQGTYIPLHGIQYIIEAANQLRDHPDIHFTLIGKGQEYENIVTRSKELQLKNITFVPMIPQDELRMQINQSDLCLGIFGETCKAKRVIPNKVYQYLACSKPIITGESQAVKKLLQHKRNVYFCEMANSSSLSSAILTLKEDASLRLEIADKGYELFLNGLTPKHIGKSFAEIIFSLLK
ncbi:MULTISPECIES: glycosyltransferase family 4 protein [Paenibacillus]|uniref:glycosyltransferase family 4 protein n=1 Tax=Paenibacillus TaxID=44249 RepID=UPI00048C4BCD|nr:glycosyltransferase family 4 protein [Paenibacillus sp. J14]